MKIFTKFEVAEL